MPIDPNISMSFRPTVALQQRDPLADFARLQGIQANQQTMQMNQQKMAQLQQDRQEMLALQQKMVELSGSGDLKGMFTAMAGSRDPQERIKGMAGLQKLQEQDQFRQAWGGQTGGSVGPETNQSWQPATSTGQVLPPLGAAPTPAPQTNALAAPQPNADRDRVNRLFAAGFTEEAKALAATLPKPQENLMSVGGNLYDRTKGQWITPPQDTTAKPGDRYKTVGNFIFDVKDQRFLTPPKAPGADGQKLQYVQTDQGLVAVPKEGATGEAVTAVAVKDAEGKPLSKPLKDVPSPVKRAIAENNRNLRLAKTALSLIQGKDVGKLKGDKEATGYKGYAPEAALQRMDEKGIDTRAAIADLGSMIIHERSGAAVTASEYPRLRPFIPLVTDDPKTVEKKLERFIQVYEEVQKDYNDMYSKDQGYNVGGQSAAAPIYAVNDATGERLMSTDGGQTWSPAK